MKEETGLDIAELILEDDRIDRHIKQQRSKLFIVAGVRLLPLSARFYPADLHKIMLITVEKPIDARGAVCVGSILIAEPMLCRLRRRRNFSHKSGARLVALPGTM